MHAEKLQASHVLVPAPGWRARVMTALLMLILAGCVGRQAQAEPCLEITLTGTMGGPPAFGGLAHAGTLVKYGDSQNACSDILLQFDTGRGTLLSLSKLGINPARLNAVFFTHMHSDHTEGFAALAQLRWHFMAGSLDVVCSADASASKPPPERTISCSNFVRSIAEPLIQAGEIAQRLAENPRRAAGGPTALLELKTVAQPLPEHPGRIVWRSGDVKVSAIRSSHIAGHLSFRVDTPAGSVVIGGDAGNDKPAPPRASSTSSRVEALARGADLIVHSVIHPIMGPGKGSGFPERVFYRQSTATDLGAMAKRAGVSQLLLTHLIPALKAPKHGPFNVPGGNLDEADYLTAVRNSDFKGEVHVGHDLLTLRLPRN